jgi:hypothetical protein
MSPLSMYAMPAFRGLEKRPDAKPASMSRSISCAEAKRAINSPTRSITGTIVRLPSGSQQVGFKSWSFSWLPSRLTRHVNPLLPLRTLR